MYLIALLEIDQQTQVTLNILLAMIETINNMNNVVSGLNNSFVSVGPKLAEEINDPQPKERRRGVEDYRDRSPSSIFLRAVEEKEIIDIVSKCNNKMSTPWN